MRHYKVAGMGPAGQVFALTLRKLLQEHNAANPGAMLDATISIYDARGPEQLGGNGISKARSVKHGLPAILAEATGVEMQTEDFPPGQLKYSMANPKNLTMPLLEVGFVSGVDTALPDRLLPQKKIEQRLMEELVAAASGKQSNIRVHFNTKIALQQKGDGTYCLLAEAQRSKGSAAGAAKVGDAGMAKRHCKGLTAQEAKPITVDQNNTFTIIAAGARGIPGMPDKDVILNADRSKSLAIRFKSFELCESLPQDRPINIIASGPFKGARCMVNDFRTGAGMLIVPLHLLPKEDRATFKQNSQSEKSQELAKGLVQQLVIAEQSESEGAASASKPTSWLNDLRVQVHVADLQIAQLSPKRHATLPKGVVCIGDAMTQVHPIGGWGNTLAIYAAVELAKLHFHCLVNDYTAAETHALVGHLYKEQYKRASEIASVPFKYFPAANALMVAIEQYEAAGLGKEFKRAADKYRLQPEGFILPQDINEKDLQNVLKAGNLQFGGHAIKLITPESVVAISKQHGVADAGLSGSQYTTAGEKTARVTSLPTAVMEGAAAPEFSTPSS